jgi:hypothetical protein
MLGREEEAKTVYQADVTTPQHHFDNTVTPL